MGCNCNFYVEDDELIQPDNYENEKPTKNKIMFHKSSPNLNMFYNKDKSTLDFLNTITENSEAKNKENQKNIVTEEENEEEEEDEEKDNTRPSDEFSQILFDKINQLRENPRSFIELIQNSESNIELDKHKRLIYKSKVKVALNKGVNSFEEAKMFLSNTKPMKKLIYDHKMKINLPKNEEEIKNKNYLKNQIFKKGNNGVYIRTYWREIISDPDTCFVLLIVDDNGKNTGKKRRDILNPFCKYIGISSIMINKSFACYITLK